MHYLRSIGSFLLFVIVALLFAGKSESTPLDDYVHAADPHFGWTVIRTYEQPDYILYILNFTSQKWLDETFTDKPIWWHYLCISVPHKLTRPNTAFMIIDGGHNTDGIPKPQDNMLALTSMFAVSSGSLGIHLQDVPNQPFRFLADPSNRSRSEDALIAWTWKTFIENPSNPYILLRMPMTKAAVRAMDAVQQFAQQLGAPVPKSFVIGGASKRGWATWTTAAVDNERVVGAVPIVMDMLKLQKNMHHHYRSLAGWTFAFNDYYELNITQYVDNPNINAMGDIIDPYSYLDRYQKVKLVQIQTGGDEFFLPDNEDTFWTDLQAATGGSFLRRLPNAEHSCAGHEISLFFTMRSFYLSLYDNRPLPSYKWVKNSNNTHGYIRATIDFSVGPKPISVYGYHARTLNDKRRDFRLVIGDPKHPGKAIANPVFWMKTDVVTEAPTATTQVYSLTIEKPMSGWEAFFYSSEFSWSRWDSA
jgi:PhoPQ-activated pathogenicity-related protein